MTNQFQWMKSIVSPNMSLGEVITRIDASGLQVAIVLDQDRKLLGIITDGDIRRAILSRKNFDVSVLEIMNRSVTMIHANASSEEMLSVMRRKKIHHLPLLDENNVVVGLATLNDLIGRIERPHWIVLMVGGLGTRLHPLTHHCPKPLLQIGGKPILETILERFVDQGFQRFFFAVNYKAEMICDYFGNGEKWGVEISYLRESKSLGTAGALSLLPEKPSTSVIVMNGDLLTQTYFDNLLQFHDAHDAALTMAVREYDLEVPYGVVQLNYASIVAIEEKPIHKFYVNAGIYVLSPEVFSYLPQDTYIDMPMLFNQLISSGKSAIAYPMREYWLDIGRFEELERAKRECPQV